LRAGRARPLRTARLGSRLSRFFQTAPRYFIPTVRWKNALGFFPCRVNCGAAYRVGPSHRRGRRWPLEHVAGARAEGGGRGKRGRGKGGGKGQGGKKNRRGQGGKGTERKGGGGRRRRGGRKAVNSTPVFLSKFALRQRSPARSGFRDWRYQPTSGSRFYVYKAVSRVSMNYPPSQAYSKKSGVSAPIRCQW